MILCLADEGGDGANDEDEQLRAREHLKTKGKRTPRQQKKDYTVELRCSGPKSNENLTPQTFCLINSLCWP